VTNYQMAARCELARQTLTDRDPEAAARVRDGYALPADPNTADWDLMRDLKALDAVIESWVNGTNPTAVKRRRVETILTRLAL